jgi:transposase
LADPAVHQSIDVDLALVGHDDQLLRDVERSILTTAKPHDAHTRYLLRTGPGSGESLSLVLLYAIHDLQRCPRGQDVVSYCRLVTWATESAGTRDGTSGSKMGQASLTGAFSAAAVLFLRAHPAGQKDLARLANTHGQGKALTVLAHKLARAVYDIVKRHTAFDMPTFLSQEGAERVSRTPHGTGPGGAWGERSERWSHGVSDRPGAHRPCPLSPPR